VCVYVRMFEGGTQNTSQQYQVLSHTHNHQSMHTINLHSHTRTICYVCMCVCACVYVYLEVESFESSAQPPEHRSAYLLEFFRFGELQQLLELVEEQKLFGAVGDRPELERRRGVVD
jgi:hypothetical protein